MPAFLNVGCPCGRTLRATADQAGTEIRCWNCQATLVVPFPAAGGRLFVECLEAARAVVKAENLLGIVGGALLIAVALLVPYAGPYLGFGLLTLAAGFHAEAISRGGASGDAEGRAPWWRISWTHLAWGPALALGLTAPFLIRHALMDGQRVPLPLGGPALLGIALVCWLAIPIGPLLTASRDREGRVPAGRVLAAIRRHPLAFALALLLVPIGVAALEGLAFLLSLEQGWLGFFMADVFPDLGKHRVVINDRNPHVLTSDVPLSFSIRTYTHGLREGYTLVGAIPASIPWGPRTRVVPWFYLYGRWHLPLVRVLCSTLILSALGVLLAIQAHWLGLIATIDSRRTSRVRESEVHQSEHHVLTPGAPRVDLGP